MYIALCGFLLIYIFIYLYNKKRSICLENQLSNETEKQKKEFLFFVFLMLSLVMGLRHASVGRDTQVYKETFENYLKVSIIDILLGNVETFERGYALMMRLSGALIPSYYFFQIIIAFAYCFGMAKFIYDNSEDILISTLVFLGLMYFQAFNGIRQWFAVMLLANSWTYFKRQKFFPAFILFCFAISVHKTSILFLAVYILYPLKDRKLIIQLIPIICSILAVFYKEILNFVSKLGLYEQYFDNTLDKLPFGMSLIMWLILGAVSLYVIYAVKERNSGERIIGALSLFYIITSFIGLKFNFFDRLGWYFAPFYILLLAFFGKYLSAKFKSFYNYGVCISFFVFFIFSMINVPELTYSFFFK